MTKYQRSRLPAPRSLALLLLATLAVVPACGGGGGDGGDPVPPPDPSVPGTIRIVPEARVLDPAAWGPELDLALEAEYWDHIVNSDHEGYDVWHAKIEAYLAANAEAEPRLELLRVAGAVFRLSSFLGETEGRDWTSFPYVETALFESAGLTAKLPDHEPAHVFQLNNAAMGALLLGQRERALDALEAMLRLEVRTVVPNTEGPAAASFTYGMIDDPEMLRFAIDLCEDCRTQICNWTSRLAPFKPIGQRMMLAELHAVAGDLDSMERVLDEAEALARERDWPFRDRIPDLRRELPTRTYGPGLGALRSPLPVYANRVNCSGCHVGAVAGTSGVDLEEPYAGADVPKGALTPP